MKTKSPPAFPRSVYNVNASGSYCGHETHGGMSQRLFIATQLAAGDMTNGIWSTKDEAIKQAVAFYYRLADAIIAGE